MQDPGGRLRREAATWRSPTRSSAKAAPISSSSAGITGDLLSTWEQPLLVRHVEGLAACGRVHHARPARDRPVGSGARGPVDRDDDGRHPRGHGRAPGRIGPCCGPDGQCPASPCSLRRPTPSAARPRPLRPPGAGHPLGRLPVGAQPGRMAQAAGRMRAGWGERALPRATCAGVGARGGGPTPAFADWFVWHMRRSLSPGAALTAYRTAMELDVSDVSPRCACRR